MKTKLSFYSLLCLLALLLTAYSCGKDCPGFPDNLTDYFPYQQNQTLVFVNENADTLSVLINERYKTEKYRLEALSKCDCDASYMFSTAINNDYNIKIGGWIYLPCESTSSISCSFVNDELRIDTTKDAFNSKNASLFGDIVTMNKNDADRISHLVIVKGEGITEFYDKQYACTWKAVK